MSAGDPTVPPPIGGSERRLGHRPAPLPATGPQPRGLDARRRRRPDAAGAGVPSRAGARSPVDRLLSSAAVVGQQRRAGRLRGRREGGRGEPVRFVHTLGTLAEPVAIVHPRAETLPPESCPLNASL